MGRRVDRTARMQALQDSWRDGAFHCFYTGVQLIDDRSRWRDHRYDSFEHRTPGDESSVVVISDLINRMKIDLSEPEFKRLVAELARRFEPGEFDQTAFPEGKVP